MRNILVFLSFIGLLHSCDFNKSIPGSRGLIATGKVGEILVVCDQGIWDSEIRNYLDSNLTQWIMPYFPDVPTFELIHKTPNHFTKGVQRYRNTLLINIDPKHTKNKARIVKKVGVWAHEQLVVEITGKDFNQVLEACKSGLKPVHSEFESMEWLRIMHNFQRNNDDHLNKHLKQNMGISLAFPDGSRMLSKRTNFIRVEFPSASRPIEFVGTGTQDVGKIVSGVLVYQYDFIDSSQMTLKSLLQARDTMLKYNVPHEIEGLYMGTQYTDLVYPESIAMSNASNSIKGVDMRGMFVFTGKPVHSTGGAFWSFHFIHPKTKKIVCISGYVDAPSTTSWTHSLREIQAILKSVEID